MCRESTRRSRWAAVLLALTAGLTRAQGVAGWQPVGSGAVRANAPDLAAGPVERVWLTADGTVAAATATGTRWERREDRWTVTAAQPAPFLPGASAVRIPESGARVVNHPAQAGELWAIGQQVWRSEDGGRNWTNLTGVKGQSLLGGPMVDLAFSTQNPDEVIVCGATGVWHSADRGATWNGWNEGLPALPGKRLLQVPKGTQGLRIALENEQELEWLPGERLGWRPSSGMAAYELLRRQAFSAFFREPITAAASRGSVAYAGNTAGVVRVTSDGGQTWRTFEAGEGPVRAFWLDPQDALLALAVSGKRVLRTVNGGVQWDDITANLPAGQWLGVAGHRATGMVYVAGEQGVYSTRLDLTAAELAKSWQRLEKGLPAASVRDVAVDAGGTRLYALVSGYGVFTAIAPLAAAQVVSAADLTVRPAAPGALLHVVGGSAASLPVVTAQPGEAQVQVPYNAQGPVLRMELQGAAAVQVPLVEVSPAIFVSPDGAPVLVDAETGTVLDALAPARPGMRVQVLAAGLGAVTPDWPAGQAAPAEAPPVVRAAVKVQLGGEPIVANRATLAPGYVGVYLVEFTVPRIVSRGAAELVIEAAGRVSNPVLVHLEP